MAGGWSATLPPERPPPKTRRTPVRVPEGWETTPVWKIDENPTSSHHPPASTMCAFPTPRVIISAVWNPDRGSGRVWDRFPGVPLRGTPGYPLEPLRGGRAGTGRFGAMRRVVDVIQRGNIDGLGRRPSTSPFAHPVRAEDCGPEGTQEGRRRLERSSTPGKPAPQARRQRLIPARAISHAPKLPGPVPRRILPRVCGTTADRPYDGRERVARRTDEHTAQHAADSVRSCWSQWGRKDDVRCGISARIREVP